MARSRRKGKKLRKLTWLVAGLIVVSAVSYRYVEQVGHDRPARESTRFTVKKVVDGDTVELTGGDKLRLLSVDTPEKGERFHDEARDLLARLTKDRPAKVEYADTRRDKYGRLLGYLYVDDTLFVNQALVDSGFAYVYLFKDNDRDRSEVRHLIEAQRRAIERKQALFGLSYEREEYYVANASSFRLHRPGCESVSDIKPHNVRRFATREEGIGEGLSPCRNCKP
ncbi:MAG: thermonuclease family protein [bacterium]|nr:thermonuclease family protein [bacterium]